MGCREGVVSTGLSFFIFVWLGSVKILLLKLVSAYLVLLSLLDFVVPRFACCV